tara:strand:- start:98 stop:307 length:210 start_codon:yes stop_codon:yes gene_type:complete
MIYNDSQVYTHLSPLKDCKVSNLISGNKLQHEYFQTISLVKPLEQLKISSPEKNKTKNLLKKKPIPFPV